MKKLLLPFLLLFIFSNFLSAQTKSISGKIIDQVTKETLPYATIQIPNTSNGTVSNENGEFELKLTADQNTIEISYIGYQDVQKTITKSTNSLLIELSTFDFNLQEVIVRSKSPLEYIREAIKNYPGTITTAPFSSQGFFLEKSKLVNDKSGAYTKGEAVFNSYFPNFGDTSHVNQNQLALYRFKEEGEFRSMLYENKKIKRKMKKGKISDGKNGKEGEENSEEGDSEEEEDGMDINIDDMTGGGPSDLLEMAQSVLSLDFLQEKNFKKIDFTFGANTYFKNRDLIVIDFLSRRKIDGAKFNGSIYLDYENLAIVAIKYRQDYKIPFLINTLIRTVAGFKIDQVIQDVSIQNQYFEGKWFPKELIRLTEITLLQKGMSELISSEQLFNIYELELANPNAIKTEVLFNSDEEYESQIYSIKGLDWDGVNVVR